MLAYSSFKTVLKFEPYLCVVKNVKIRSCLSKFRMSCHDLEIERGRYDTKPKYFSERYCLSGLKDGLLVTEDEVHFFANCALYKARRKILFEFVETMYPSVNSLGDVDKLIWYMSQENNEVINKVVNLVYNCFKRGKCLSKQKEKLEVVVNS